MNKIFKVIWSKSKQCYVVVSEMAKNKTGKKKIVVVSILAALAMQVGVVADVTAADRPTGTIEGGTKMYSNLTNGLAIGNESQSNSDQSIAIGYRAVANSQYANPAQPAVAIGAGASATGRGGVSLGLIANSSVRGTAIGSATQATGFGAFAGGTYAQATNGGDVAIGGATSDRFDDYAVASGGYSVAIGTAAKADGGAGVSIGYKTNAKTSNSLAVGSESQATGEGAVAVGRKNTSTGASSTVLGILSTASATSATAVGMQTTATGENSLAVGHQSSAIGRNSVAVGTNGTTAALGGVAVGQAAKANKFTSVAMGMNVTADGDNSVALGGSASANSDGTIAIGSYGSTPTKATGNKALAIGAATTANGLESIAIGSRVNSASQHSIAIGTGANASAVKSVAIGPDSRATVDGGVALGRDSVANVIGGITNKGYNPNTNRTDIYSGLTGNVLTSTTGAVSIGNGTTVTRQLTGLAAGTKDTDAVNVAQLKSVNLAFSGNVNTGNVNIANSTLGIKGDNTYITTAANGQNLTISGKTQNINVTNGQASANAAGMADSKNVADAINKAISANAYHWKLAADNTSTAPEVINKSDTVIFGGDNNITVTRSGKKITTSLNKAITVDTVKANKSVTVSNGGNQITLDGSNGAVSGRSFTGQSFTAGNNVLSNTTLQMGLPSSAKNVTISGDGLTAKNGTRTVKIGTDGISAGGQQITNVSSGGNVGTNAANITDVKNTVDAVTLKLDTNSKTGTVKLSESPLKVIGANGIRTDLVGTNNGSLVVGFDNNTINATTKGIGLTGDTGTTGLKHLKDGDATFKVYGDSNLVSTKASTTGVQVAVDAAKVKDLAVGAVTVSKANTADNPITITPTAGTNTKDYAIGIDTTKLANQTQLTYKANGANANKVSLANGLNFTDGTFTKATVGTNGNVTISTATETITNDADGKAKVNSPTDGLATAKNVADSINKAVDGLSQNLTVSDGATDGTVNLKNQKLTVSGTNGVTTTVNGQTVTVGLDAATKTKVDNASTAVARNISLGADSGTASSQSLKDGDVAFNVKGATGDLVSTKMNGNTVEISTKRAAITSDANTGAASVTGDDGLATSKNVADAINKAADAAKAGAAWNLTTNSSTTDKTTVQGGDTVDLINGDNILITQDGTDKKKITVATKKDLTVDSITAGNTVMNTSGLTNGTTAITGTGITTDKVTVGGISIDKTDGINGGNKTITNVASGGTTDTNAANIGDVKQAVANLSQNLNITDGTNNGTIDLKNQKLNVAGTNGVTAIVNGQTVTVGLDDNTVNATTKGIGLTGDTGSTGNKYLKDGDVSFAVVGDGNLVSTSATATGVKVAVDAAKVKDLAVAAVTVSKDAQADNPITVTPTAGTNSNDYAIGIDTTKLAAKTDLTYRANSVADANAKKVSLSKGLDFVNGTLTTASVDNDGVVKYDVNTAVITAGTDGTITGPTTDGVATAQNVADAINAAKKAAKTEITANAGEVANATKGNVTLTSTTAADGHTIYDVKLNDKVTLGSGANAVTIDGTTGAITGKTANIGGVTVNGTANTIGGLSNTTWNGTATTGRAATEDQLKAVADAAGSQTWEITADKKSGTSGAQTGTKENAKVGKDDTVSLIAGENLTVDQASKNFTYSLNKDLVKMNSATFEATGGKTTVIKGNSIVQTDGANVNTSNATSNTITDGTNTSTITAGKAQIGTVGIDGVASKISTGGTNAVVVNGADGTVKTGNVTVTGGTTNDITGLSNTTLSATDFATKGRAATEEQLKAATGATTLKFTGDVATNTGSVNLKDDTFGIKGDGKYISTDVNGKNVNLTVSEAEVKKSAVAAVTVSTDTTDANNPLTVTPTTSADGTTKDYKVTIDGTKIANKTNLSYKANDGTAKQVSLADGLNFKNGTLTTASIDDNGVVKYDVNTASITAGADGTITGPTTDGVATAQNVADAINAAKKASKTEITANTGEAANATTGNVTLTSTTAADGHTIYDVKLNDKVTLGSGANAVTIDGTTGAITGKTANIGGVTVNGTANTIGGLSNTTWNGTATTGRAATEDQLKAVADAASSQTWNITADKAGTTGNQTGTKKNATVGKDETVELVAGDNLTINQNERKFTYSLNKDLAGLTSVSIGTGTTETIKLDGATGKITAKNAAIGGVTIDGDNKHVNGLSNTTWNGTATTGRAATEDQLKAVAETAKTTTDAVNLKFTGDTNTSPGVVNLKDDTLGIVGDGKYVSTDANGKNLTVKVSEAEVKKSAVAAVTVSTDTTDANNPLTVTPTTSADGTTKDYKVTIDGTKIANKTNLSYKANDGTAKQVSLADGLNFKNGTLTTASIDDNGVVKYDVNTASITAGADGTITGPTTDGVATAQNVADAINAAKKASKTEITANTGEAANATTGNVTLTSTTAADGHTIYDVKLNDKVTLGSGANAVTIDGTTGAITGKTATIGGVTVNGTANTIGGLSNTTWNGTATTGRAATEDQLKAVADAAGSQTWEITADKKSGTSGAQTGTKENAKVGKDDKVSLIAGENLTVDQVGKNFTYSLNTDLVKMNSATFEATGGKTTVIKGDSIVQTDGNKTNTATASGNTVANGTKSTETTAAGQVIKDGAKSNKSTVDNNVIDDGNGNVNTSNATSNTITDGTNTTATTSRSVTVKDNAGNSTVITKDNITTGVGANKITLDGTAGKATIGSSIVDGVNNTFTTGGANAVKLDGAAGTIKTGTVTVTGGTTNDITGLSNTTVTAADFATKGRAATEEQLKAVGEQTWQITADKDATTSGAQTGTKKDAKVGKDDKVQLIAGENMTVNQNERDFTFTLNKDLVKMNSATFLGTGSNTTVITGNSITQTAGTQTNTSTASGNTVADGTKSTETTAAGQVIKDGTKTNTSTVDENTIVDGTKSNKSTVDGNTITDGTNTTATTSSSVTVKDNAGNSTVITKDNITTGVGANKITLDGTAGKATIGSSIVDGVNNTFTTGGANAVKLDGAAGTIKTGTVTVTGGTTNDITGLSNTTVTAADFATKGRAATEEQLKAVGEQTWQITADKDATTSGAQTGTKKDAKVGKDDKVQLIAGENMTVNQNERDFTFTLNKDLVKMNSATFLGTGSNTTVITGNSITQTAGTQTNTSTAGGNTVADGTKSTETTAAGQVIKDGAKSNKSTVDSNVIDDGNGNVNTSNATSNTITDGTNTTEVTASTVTVKDNAGNSTVITKDTITTGTGANKVTVDGTAGKVTAGTAVIDGVNNSIITGGANTIKLDGAAGTVTGLTNKTWTPGVTKAVSGRAATEDQLQQVSDAVGAGWKVNTGTVAGSSGISNGAASTKVSSGEEVKLQAGDNLVIDQNGKTVSYSLNKDLTKMNSATFEATGGKTTVIKGDSIVQTDGGKTNTSNAAGNTVVDGNKSTATTAAGTTITDGAKTNTSTADKNVIDDGAGNKSTFTKDGITITKTGKDTVSLTSDGLDNGKNKIVNVAAGVTNTDAVNVGQLKEYAAKSTTELTANNGETAGSTTGNIVLTKTTAADGHTIYDNKLNDKITLGSDPTKAVTVDGTTGMVTGLTNKTWTPGSIVSGRAATEDQLKEAVADSGWKAAVDKEGSGQSTVVGTSPEKIKAEETVTFKAGNNMMVTQTGKSISYAVNPELTNMTSATFKDAAGNTTVTNGNGITITPGSANPTNPHAGLVSLTKDGLNNGNNQIKGVAPGTDPTDAVNVSQLNASNANTSQAINQIAGEVQHVGAHAAAMAALKPIQYDPLEPTQVMAGVGNYRGETAAALGLAHYTNENTMFNVGVSVGGNHNMVNAGVTHKFGYSPEKKNIPDRYKAGPISSVYVMQDEVSSLKKENAEQKYVIADQAARLTTLEAENEQQRRELAETKKGLDDLKAAVDKLLASKG